MVYYSFLYDTIPHPAAPYDDTLYSMRCCSAYCATHNCYSKHAAWRYSTLRCAAGLYCHFTCTFTSSLSLIFVFLTVVCFTSFLFPILHYTQPGRYSTLVLWCAVLYSYCTTSYYSILHYTPIVLCSCMLYFTVRRCVLLCFAAL